MKWGKFEMDPEPFVLCFLLGLIGFICACLALGPAIAEAISHGCL